MVIALLAGIAIHFSRTHEELATIQRLSVRMLIAVCLLQFVSQLFLNASLLLPLQTCVTRLGFWELYLVRAGGFLAGSLVPVAGGLAVRLAYLRNRGLTYLDFTWATLLSNVLALVAAAVLGVFATGVLWIVAGPPPAGVLGVSAGVLAISVAALAVFELLPRAASHPKLQRWRWFSTMRSLGASRAMAALVFAHSLARHCVNFVTFGLLTQSLSRGAGDFLAGGLIYALTILTGLIAALAFRGVGLVGQGIGVLIGSAWLALEKRRQQV